MAPIPLTSGPETPPSSPPNLTTPVQAEEGGFCGLTVDQLHLVMIFVVFCECDFARVSAGIFSVLMRSVPTSPPNAFRSASRPLGRRRHIVGERRGYLLTIARSAEARRDGQDEYVSVPSVIPSGSRRTATSPSPRNSPQGCAKSCSDTCFRRTTYSSPRLAPTLLRAVTPSSPSSSPWLDVGPVSA
jgi:hypothetical protein